MPIAETITPEQKREAREKTVSAYLNRNKRNTENYKLDITSWRAVSRCSWLKLQYLNGHTNKEISLNHMYHKSVSGENGLGRNATKIPSWQETSRIMEKFQVVCSPVVKGLAAKGRKCHVIIPQAWERRLRTMGTNYYFKSREIQKPLK